MTTPNIQQILKNIPLKKSPVTSQYITSPTVEIKKREFPNYQKKGLSENIIANYHFICLLGREVADSLAIFSEKGIISSSNINFIERGMSKDMEHTWELAKKSGRTQQYYEDFELLVAYFKNQATHNLSQYQKATLPLLEDALATILIMDYSFHSAEFITRSNNQKLSVKQMRILVRKYEELKKWFEKNFATVSNLKFDFPKFKPIWTKINGMKYQEARNFLQNSITTI